MPKAKSMSLADALALTGDARIVTRSTPPYSIVHTNRAWSDITGYKFTEIVGNTCAFLQGGKTVGPALKALHKALEARKPCHEVLINYRRDGTPFRNTITCQLASGGMFYIGTLRGEVITDGSVPPIERSPEELQRLPLVPKNYANPDIYPHAGKRQRREEKGNMQLAELLENTVDPIVFCAKEFPHHITHANKPWLEMCGYDLEEVEGLTNKILTGPETDAEALKRLNECVRRREPSLQTVINYKRGGVRFLNEVQTTPVHDENDDLAGFMSMLREVDDSLDWGENTEHLWAPLQQKLERNRVSDGAADPDAGARVEAATKLIGNRSAVLNDITNPVPSPSQPDLKRVDAGVRSYVDQMLREVAKRLLGDCAARCIDERLPAANPVQKAQQAAWAEAAQFLSKRIQTAPVASGRAPDMSPAAATAMRTVLHAIDEEARA